ncbi:Fungal specific transcription factor, partial [Rhizopus stolonifer]
KQTTSDIASAIEDYPCLNDQSIHIDEPKDNKEPGPGPEANITEFDDCFLLDQDVKDDECDSIDKQMQGLKISNYQRTRYIGSSAGVHFLNDALFRHHKRHPLPREPSWFIQKVNDDEDEHVIMKTQEITAASIPPAGSIINRIEIFEDMPLITERLADYLVHMYFTRIHHYCPIINKVQFLEEYYFHCPTPPDKYLLYSVVFVGVSVFISDLSDANVFDYTPEQLTEIQTYLKTQSQKLYTIAHKRSMISTIQALMLQSMFVGHNENDEEGTSHWLISGMAIRIAQDMGLHRDCSTWRIPSYEIELRKRIWYACYLMDKWVAAELGRPISIVDQEFDAQLPSPYELDYPSQLAKNNKCEAVPILIMEAEISLQQKQPVYTAFLYLVTLSQISGRVLVGLHSTRARHDRAHDLELLKILDHDLADWKASLPHELQIDLDNPNYCFSASAGVVNIAYSAILLLLYRPFIRKNSGSQMSQKALQVCTTTATRLASIIEAMDRNSYVALPWNLLLYASFQAAIIFLHNAKGSNEELAEESRKALIRCAKIYQTDQHLKKLRFVKLFQKLIESFDVSMIEFGQANFFELPKTNNSFYTLNSNQQDTNNLLQSVDLSLQDLPCYQMNNTQSFTSSNTFAFPIQESNNGGL